jgi:hypothetical protein
MIQQVARVGRRSWVVFAIAVGLLLAAAGSAVLPAAPASASTTVVAVFSSSNEYITPLCSDPGTYDQSGSAVEVYNPCSTRVWVHYYSGSSVETYCVNPGGGLAYDLPIRWAGGDTSDLQITTNTAPCYAANASFQIAWLASCSLCFPAWDLKSCQMGQTFTNKGEWVYAVWNNETSTNEGPGTCNVRIWVHEYDNGTGNAACIDPGGVIPASEGYRSPVYWQVDVTNVQAPCSAGSPPYPY